MGKLSRNYPTSEAVEAALNRANKAEADINNLQAQIDEIVISSSAEAIVAPEVAQARVGEDGTEYTTLKDRLDSEVKLIRDDLLSTVVEDIYVLGDITDGEYYDIDGEVQSSQYWSTCTINVLPYKRIIYSGVTHTSDNLRSVFINKNNRVIATFPMETGQNVIDVPKDASVVVFSIHTAEKDDFVSLGINRNVFIDDSQIVEHNNYLDLSNYSGNGITIVRNEDDTLTINGAASLVTDVTICTLQAGTYTALYKFVSGSTTSTSDISVRVNDERWVNNHTKVSTVSLTGITEVKLRISGGAVLNNAKVEVVINKGTEVDEEANWRYTALDQKAREMSTKNASDISDNSDLISIISEESSNMFYVTTVPQTLGGITITTDTKGRIVINGTSSGSVKIPLMGAVSASNTNLPAGTYTAKIERVSGTISTAGNISLRYGDVSSGSGTRWVISTTPIETDTFESDQSVILYISPNTEFHDATYELQIEQGETVGNFYPYGFITGYDKIARDKIAEIEAEITDVPELSLTDFEYELIGGGLNALNSLYDVTGKLFNVSYVTDTHIDIYQNTRHGEDSFKLFNSITNYCDISVHMGDVVQSTGRTRAEALHNFEVADYLMRDAKSCVICRGNHDTNVRAGYPINTAVFNTMEMRRRPANFISNPNDTNKMYGYMDFAEYKLRVYFLDPYDDLTLAHSGSSSAPYNDVAIITENQLDWLFVQNAVTDTTWTALIFSHNSTASTLKYQEADSKNSSFRTKLATMIGNGIPVVLCHGNNHKDAWQSVVCGNSVGNILDITFENGFYNFNDSDDIAKGYYFDGQGNLIPKDLYCVGFISIDTTNHIIYDTRIGRGSSRTWHYGLSDSDIYEISN